MPLSDASESAAIVLPSACVATTADHLPDDTTALKAALIETRAKLVGRRGADRASATGDRQDEARDVRSALRAQPAADRSAGAAARGAGRGRRARMRRRPRRRASQVQGFTRRQATRRNFPAHLPRRRIVHPAPTACPCCGGSKLSKIGEDVTETLDVVPRQWFVTEHVREKFSCRVLREDHPAAGAVPCDRPRLCRAEPAGDDPGRQVRQPSAAQPAERALCARGDRARRSRPWPIMSAPARPTLTPLYELIKAHVFAAERIHGDDTTVPVLAKVKTADRADLDLCPRRPAVRRPGAAGGGVLLLAGSGRHPSRAASRRLLRDPAGRRLCRVQCALRAGSKAGTDHGSRMLGACAAQAVRACRHRLEGAQAEADDDLADRFRGGSEVRRHLRAGALDQRLVARGSAWPRAARTSRRWSTISSSG